MKHKAALHQLLLPSLVLLPMIALLLLAPKNGWTEGTYTATDTAHNQAEKCPFGKGTDINGRVSCLLGYICFRHYFITAFED